MNFDIWKNSTQHYSALNRIEGDSLLCGGITLVAHFKELNLTQNCQNFLETSDSSKITLTMCVLILVKEFLGFCPCWWEDMKKLTELSTKSYLEAWNPSLFIKFVIINTSNGFSYIKFNQTLPIFKPKKLLFFLKSWPHVCQLTNQKTKLHLNVTNDDQLKS